MTLLSLQRNQRKMSLHQQYPPWRSSWRNLSGEPLKLRCKARWHVIWSSSKRLLRYWRRAWSWPRKISWESLLQIASLRKKGELRKNQARHKKLAIRNHQLEPRRPRLPPFHSCLQMKSQRQRQQRTNHPNLQRRPQRNLTRTLVRAANFLDWVRGATMWECESWNQDTSWFCDSHYLVLS